MTKDLIKFLKFIPAGGFLLTGITLKSNVHLFAALAFVPRRDVSIGRMLIQVILHAFSGTIEDIAIRFVKNQGHRSGRVGRVSEEQLMCARGKFCRDAIQILNTIYIHANSTIGSCDDAGTAFALVFAG